MMTLDDAVLRELEQVLGHAIVQELIASFISDAGALVVALRVAHDAADVQGELHATHTLKSTAETLGAPALAALCAEVEAQGRAGALASTAQVERIEAELVKVHAAFAARPR
ncbi:MAG: Hpt domain-containing protein [Proteobacteria bacterium]|nr:Hpt domain-containing protein [Pseudomonadota bacterium]